MVRSIYIFFSFFLLVGCNYQKADTKNPEKMTYLDSVIPYMDAFAKDTAIIFDWNGTNNVPDSLYEETPISHIVGKIIDNTQIFALVYAPQDTLLNFYRLDQGKWKTVGSHIAIADCMTFVVDFIDMDDDGNNEIIVRTPPNMNGNTWQDVFCYSAKADSIELAGSFSTDYDIKKDSKTVEETYGGSWWMTNTKTLYQWNNGKLIPIKRLELSLKEGTLECEDYILEYYEMKDSLTQIFKVPYKGKKYKDMWDNFFNNTN